LKRLAISLFISLYWSVSAFGQCSEQDHKCFLPVNVECPTPDEIILISENRDHQREKIEVRYDNGTPIYASLSGAERYDDFEKYIEADIRSEPNANVKKYIEGIVSEIEAGPWKAVCLGTERQKETHSEILRQNRLKLTRYN
jgi:hypothetical protein